MPTAGADTLRLLWPQWQGAGASSVSELAGDLPAEVIRKGYVVGSAVLQAVLPPHAGPTAHVPTLLNGDELVIRDGIQGKDVILAQLRAALEVIAEHDPARIVTLGGECSVSVAPFAHLAHRYGSDVALLWVDSHPDTDTGDTGYEGYHAMAVSALTGHGDPDVLAALPATFPAEHVALLGLHAWVDDAYAHVGEWGLSAFAPDDLRTNSTALLRWLATTGCSRVVIHFDVDTIDSNEVYLGLGGEPGGLSSAQARRVVQDVSQVADVVGLTAISAGECVACIQ